MSINSKMTAIANPIRTLKGTSGAMGLDAMASNLGEVVNECDTQADLITQIKTALADKAAGGVELPTLTKPAGTSDDLVEGKQLIGADGSVVDGSMEHFSSWLPDHNASFLIDSEGDFGIDFTLDKKKYFDEGRTILWQPATFLGEAKPEDVRAGVTFTSEKGVMQTGEALLPGGGSVYPDGAFAPVTNFTDGKQYALVATINGVRRYLNNTTFNDWTMNATEIAIAEDAGDYLLFSATPVLFTAVASGDGFLLQNGSNYLSGNDDNGSALRVNTTQAVWTVNTSESAGLEEGKYLPKEESNAVWLFTNYKNYDWTLKFEEDNNSFGFDRNGRDSNNSKGYASFVLYEYVAGEGEINPIVDTSDATATADDMAEGTTAYVNGKKVTGSLKKFFTGTIPFSSMLSENGNVKIVAQPEQKTIIHPDPGLITVPVPFSNFGNATAADVSAGKTFTSSAGLKVTGTATIGNTGSTIKTGTTTSGTINTGLSEIDYLILYKTAVAETGVIQIVYRKDTGNSAYTYCSSYSSFSSRYAVAENTNGSVSGGTFTWGGSSTQGLSSGNTYNWIAIGK